MDLVQSKLPVRSNAAVYKVALANSLTFYHPLTTHSPLTTNSALTHALTLIHNSHTDSLNTHSHSHSHSKLLHTDSLTTTLTPIHIQNDRLRFFLGGNKNSRFKFNKKRTKKEQKNHNFEKTPEMFSNKILAFACYYCAILSFTAASDTLTAASDTLTEVVHRFRHRTTGGVPLPPATSFININVYSDTKCSPSSLIGTDSIAQGICVVDLLGLASFTISTTATNGLYTYQPFSDGACTSMSVSSTFSLPTVCSPGSTTNPIAPAGTYYTATVSGSPAVTQSYVSKVYASAADCQSGNGNYMELAQYPTNCLTVSSTLAYLVTSCTCKFGFKNFNQLTLH